MTEVWSDGGCQQGRVCCPALLSCTSWRYLPDSSAHPRWVRALPWRYFKSFSHDQLVFKLVEPSTSPQLFCSAFADHCLCPGLGPSPFSTCLVVLLLWTGPSHLRCLLLFCFALSLSVSILARSACTRWLSCHLLLHHACHPATLVPNLMCSSNVTWPLQCWPWEPVQIAAISTTLRL